VREWMSEKEAAAEIDVSVRTLREWRKKRYGPPYAFFGRIPRYHRASLAEHFLKNQIMPVRKSRRGA
jgi:DNA-binding transcriptional MerR regulator